MATGKGYLKARTQSSPAAKPHNLHQLVPVVSASQWLFGPTPAGGPHKAQKRYGGHAGGFADGPDNVQSPENSLEVNRRLLV
jgi:hypothetical protein